jgi:diguanylate cyclase (GGDEF)-like protein
LPAGSSQHGSRRNTHRTGAVPLALAAQPARAERELEATLAGFLEILGCEILAYHPLDHRDGGPTAATSPGWGPSGLRVLESPGYEAVVRLARSAGTATVLGTARQPWRGDRGTGAGNATALAAAPVITAEGPVGVLVAVSWAAGNRGDIRWTLDSFAATLALWLENPAFRRWCGSSAHIDDLTGCLTYAALRNELARGIDRASRTDEDLSVCFIDLDGFKQVNSEQGHLRANDILAAVGQRLRQAARSYDTIGRFGGDEFIAILSHTTQSEADAIAERLSEIIAATPTPLHWSLGASVGVAQWAPTESCEALLTRADYAMQQNKRRKSD